MPTDVERPRPGMLRPATPTLPPPHRPATTDPSPRVRRRSYRVGPPSTRMLAVCAWATAIGLVGLAVAAWAAPTVTADAGPAWFERTFAAVGTAGVALTMGAFLTARWARTPWFLLALATVPTAVNIGLTVGVL